MARQKAPNFSAFDLFLSVHPFDSGLEWKINPVFFFVDVGFDSFHFSPALDLLSASLNARSGIFSIGYRNALSELNLKQVGMDGEHQMDT